MTAKYGIDGCYEIDADGCWIWQMYIDHRGYGTVRREGRKWGAHRYAYTFFVGPIPGDMTVDHLCFKPACVNPLGGPVARGEASTSGRAAYQDHPKKAGAPGDRKSARGLTN